MIARFSPSRRALAAAIVVTALPAAHLARADGFRMREDYWRDPAFTASITASYGFDSAVDPAITPAEKTLFESVIPVIQSNPAQAIPLLVAGITPQSSAALDFTLANLYFETGDLDRAVASYEAALRKFPSFRRAYVLLGKLEVRRGRLESAVPHFLRALELGAVDGDLYGLLGYCHVSAGNHAAALVAYRQALLHDPQSLDWKRGLAQALFQMGHWNEVIGVMDELLTLRPDDADLWAYQANAFLNLGQYGAAAANYEIIRRLGGARPEVLAQLGDILLNEGLDDLAWRTYQDALRGDRPADARLALRLAEVVVSRGDASAGKAFLAEVRARHAATLDSAQQVRLLTLEARVARQSGDNAAAERVLLQILERDPINGAALLELAGVLVETGRQSDAAFRFQAAALIPETKAEALVRHGEMLVQQGRYADALPLLREANRVRPRDTLSRYIDQVQRVIDARR